VALRLSQRRPEPLARRRTVLSKNGLLDLLDREVSSDRIYPPIHFVDKTLEFAFTHTDDYGESYFSFVNGTYTSEGGTHLSAFREGILKGINEFTGKKFNGQDVRDGIVGILAVKVQEPVFESQTKNKLGNTDIRAGIVNTVKDAVATHLYKFPETAEVFVDKVQRNERVRRELQSVRRDAKAKAKKIAFKIPQLKDCKYHPSRGNASKPGRENMLFITEGQSAAGSIVSSRDPMTQAVFSLKGKPMNVLGQRLDVLYKNEEMYSLMQALDIEESITNLRYDKVILATDADVDGLHIRNLLLTFFLHYFELLIKLERVYILETPIFRVRNKEKTFYCYSDRDMDEAIKPSRPRARRTVPSKPPASRDWARFHRPNSSSSSARTCGSAGAARFLKRGQPGAALLHGQEYAGAQAVHHGPPDREAGMSETTEPPARQAAPAVRHQFPRLHLLRHPRAGHPRCR
jgi:topoisomerase IV subunit B